MEFVLIPAGEFFMGSDEAPAALARDFPAYPLRRFLELVDEAPVHRGCASPGLSTWAATR